MARTTPPGMKWHQGLKAEVKCEFSDRPLVSMHRSEWAKVMRGDPVEINPSTGTGDRVMTVDEWAARWKRNEVHPECLSCGGTNTKEHFFSCTWCRGRKHWESETLCLDCHTFSLRRYRDPEYQTPEEWDKQYWTELTREQMSALSVNRLQQASA